MPYKIPLFALLFLFSNLILGQENKKPKIYTATRISKAPKIDGVLGDEVWKDLPVASDFVMLDPGDGNPAPSSHPTEVKLAYTDEALYVAVSLYDDNSESIRRQFAQRDNIPIADNFIIDLNTYNDGENQTRFVVTAAGTLADAKMKGENEDYSYNVVWDAQVTIAENGWFAEMRIPYSALRFPEKKDQVWGVQFARVINSRNETYVWNYIDKSVGKSTHYNGLMNGISDIDAPVRLSFYPYISAEVDQFDGRTNTNISAGMDLKYGISDAFTLDATLIPDFGQTAYDEVELNLGPFEQTFGENRAFFTEGTELFTKGDLFYSRRIGDTPVGFNEVQDELLEDEEVIDNPEKADLINALKISGRTENGLGIGFFNAITRKTSARVRNKNTEEVREVVTEPFANYNILVLDQQFDQKSSISIINTNVTREGHFRDGNVSGFLFDVYNKSSSFNFSGEAKMSNVNFPSQNLTGFASTLAFSRTKGRFRYGITHEFANETYDINDLGLNFTNNYNNFFGDTSYRIFEPTGIFNEYEINFHGSHERRYKPDVNVRSVIGTSFFGKTRDRFAFGGHWDVNTEFKDFFEPRKANTYVLYPGKIIANAWVSSDYRKRFAYDIRSTYTNFFGPGYNNLNLILSPRFRFSNKLSFIYRFEYSKENDRNSFVALQPQNVIFGNRDMESIENSLQGSYNFSTKKAISLSFRNFWSAAAFAENQFSRLQEDGELEETSYEVNSDNDPNANFNIWNLDLSYQWRFAPGSEMILLYRNAIFKLDDQSDLNYAQSLDELFQQPVRHNLSLRIVYYLDYNTVKNAI